MARGGDGCDARRGVNPERSCAPGENRLALPTLSPWYKRATVNEIRVTLLGVKRLTQDEFRAMDPNHASEWAGEAWAWPSRSRTGLTRRFLRCLHVRKADGTLMPADLKNVKFGPFRFRLPALN